MKIILASNNQGKIREINQLVASYNIQVIPQDALGVLEAEETGSTFIENALIKARQATVMTNLPALADDSGLVVPALNGAPGIFSARYAGENVNHQQNIAKLLHELSKIPGPHKAYFYCVIVLLRNAQDPSPIICEGRWDGEILDNPRGKQGFGYDPVFFDPQEQRTAAELPPEIKNKLSHRGQAMQKLLQRLHEISSD